MLGLGGLKGLFHSRSTPESKLEKTLEKTLKAAQRAEAPFIADPDYFAHTIGADHGWIHKTINDHPDSADGMWLCHCGYENTVIHFKGAHPFKYLTCGQCEQVLNEKCLTTEVLERIDVYPTHIGIASEGSKHVPYFSVCPCGLSHRATMHKNRVCFTADQCHCGRYPTKKDGRYLIGSVKPFRLDPAGRGIAMRLKKRKQTWEMVKVTTGLMSTPDAYSTKPLREGLGTTRRHETYIHTEPARPELTPRGVTVADPRQLWYTIDGTMLDGL